MRFWKETPRRKCYLLWHLLISPVLSLIFSTALPDSLLLTSKFFCGVVPLLTKWAHLEIKLEEKKNQHSTHLTPCISTQKMFRFGSGFELIRNYHTIKYFAYATYNVEDTLSSPRITVENKWNELQVVQGVFILSFQEYTMLNKLSVKFSQSSLGAVCLSIGNISG